MQINERKQAEQASRQNYAPDKYPNPIFQALKVGIEKEYHLDDEITLSDLQLLEKLTLLLKSFSPETLNTYCGQQNKFGESILHLAIRGKMYRTALMLLDAINDDTAQLRNMEGENVLHFLAGHRLQGKVAHLKGVTSFLTALHERKLLRHLLYQYCNHQALPIHLAANKAVHTQQSGILGSLLAYDRPEYWDPAIGAMIQAQDGDGNTPLHLFIKEHGESGWGLPALRYLLKGDFLCGLHVRNKAGKTPWHLVDELCESRQPERGLSVKHLFNEATRSYRKKLEEWGGKPESKEEKNKPSENNRESNFAAFYVEICHADPKNILIYQTLYAKYKEAYQPILENSVQKKNALYDRVKTDSKKDSDAAHEIVSRCQAVRCTHQNAQNRLKQELALLTESLPVVEGLVTWRTAKYLSSKEKELLSAYLGGKSELERIRALSLEQVEGEIEQRRQQLEQITQEINFSRIRGNFYEEIAKRSLDMGRYEALFTVYAPEMSAWKDSIRPATESSPSKPPKATPVTIHPTTPKSLLTERTERNSPPPTENHRLLHAAALTSAKQLALTGAPGQEGTLIDVVKKFGHPRDKAEIISVIPTLENISAAGQISLLSGLIGKPFETLTLNGCRVLQTPWTDGSGWIQTAIYWEALFKGNTQLKQLHLTHCSEITANDLQSLAEWCPNLTHLTLEEMPLTQVRDSRFLSQDHRIYFASLEMLTLTRCPTLTEIRVRAPQLKLLELQTCKQLKEVSLNTPQLRSIGCRGSTSWDTLRISEKEESKNSPLRPLAKVLTKIREQSRQKVFSVPNAKGYLLLHTAAKHGDLPVVRWYIEMGGLMNSQTKREKETPLHLAARFGQMEVLCYLLSCNQLEHALRDNIGRTALHTAAHAGNYEAVQRLCEKGLDPQARDKNAKTPEDLVYDRREDFSVKREPLPASLAKSLPEILNYLAKNISTRKETSSPFKSERKSEVPSDADPQDASPASTTPTPPLQKEKENKKEHNADLSGHQTQQTASRDELRIYLDAYNFEKAFQLALTLSLKERNKDLEIQLRTFSQKWGYGLKNVPGDGLCFFHAALDQLHLRDMASPSDTAGTLYAEAVNYILACQPDYKDTIAGDFSDYILKVSRQEVWADHPLMDALANARKCHMVLLQSDGNITIFRHPEAHQTLYLGYEMERHYQSLHEIDGGEDRVNMISQRLTLRNLMQTLPSGWTILAPDTLLQLEEEIRPQISVASAGGTSPIQRASSEAQIARPPEEKKNVHPQPDDPDAIPRMSRMRTEPNMASLISHAGGPLGHPARQPMPTQNATIPDQATAHTLTATEPKP